MLWSGLVWSGAKTMGLRAKMEKFESWCRGVEPSGEGAGAKEGLIDVRSRYKRVGDRMDDYQSELIKPWLKKIAVSPTRSGALPSEAQRSLGWMEPMMRRCVTPVRQAVLAC